VHRDVKPQNVIVPEAPRSADGVAKLADFGVAHLAGDEPLTRTGDVVGTLAYMAPEQAAGQRVDERVDLYSLALVVYEALAGSNPVRAGSPAATARRVGTVLPSLRRARRDLPEELCAAVDQALRPRPEERGTLDELAAALADALPEVSDEGGTVAPHPLERTQMPGWAGRAGAGVLAGGLVAAALAATGGPAAAGAFAGVAVAAFPRAAWLAAALAVIGLLGADDPGAALLAAAAAAPVPLLLRRAGALWSVPALAPLLGIAGLAGAFPALAGTARGWMRRAALGALGAWWGLLAQPLVARALVQGSGGVGVSAHGGQAGGTAAIGLGPLAGAPAGDAVQRALEPVVTSGALLYLLIWAVAAAVMPWLVRGRHLTVDVVAATVWAATLGAATAATAPPAPRGLVAGAVAAGALAVALKRVPAVEP
jgi:hypothetical protein